MQSQEKTHPAGLSIREFDYLLPDSQIARFPMEKRDQSGLLVYRQGSITDTRYCHVADFLRPGSLVVFNDSKVVQARLHFTTTAGNTIEIFCLEPADASPEINQSMQQRQQVTWRCLVGEARKWKEPEITLTVPGTEPCRLTARLLEKAQDAFIILFSWDPEALTFGEILEKAGKVPLPPYIKRDADPEDRIRYQTVYAKQEGSVAAPTAGLHYTPEIFDKLREKNIDIQYLSLHVGAGTFIPVKSQTMGEHHMHSEQVLVSRSFIEKLLGCLDTEVTAIGTTSARTLESLYWLGLRIYHGMTEPDESLTVSQWDPYQMDPILSPSESLQCLLTFLEEKKADTLIARTRLLIAPGYPWQIVNILATNFHQPKSTLLLLVASFVGEDWKKIYRHALNSGYRFLSYGDGSLLFRN